jgi:hypothetical protein
MPDSLINGSERITGKPDKNPQMRVMSGDNPTRTSNSEASHFWMSDSPCQRQFEKQLVMPAGFLAAYWPV